MLVQFMQRQCLVCRDSHTDRNLRRWIDREARENLAHEDGLGLRDGDFNLGMYHTLKEVSNMIDRSDRHL